MLFIEWQPLIGWAIASVVAALCVLAFLSIRKKRALIRRTVRGVAIAVFLIDAVFVSVLIDSDTSYSTAVFSPDRTMAARVIYTDDGRERDASVEVFRKHGFSRGTVYEARPLLQPDQIHWLDAKNLWLAGLDPTFCQSTDFVAVHCGLANSPAASKVPIIVRLVLHLNAPAAPAPSPHPGPPSESQSAR